MPSSVFQRCTGQNSQPRLEVPVRAESQALAQWSPTQISPASALQLVEPLHCGVQTPAAQTKEAGQTLPQVPQLFASLWKPSLGAKLPVQS